jgi:hypothetical protein
MRQKNPASKSLKCGHHTVITMLIKLHCASYNFTDSRAKILLSYCDFPVNPRPSPTSAGRHVNYNYSTLILAFTILNKFGQGNIMSSMELIGTVKT